MIKLPKKCEVNKFIPKKFFYEKLNLSSIIKQEFIDNLKKIVWKYKIAENIINISKTEDVEEIEIFEIELRKKYDSQNIIKIITKNISYPILFYIKYENEFQYAIKYNDKIFFSEWNKEINFNFSAINLDILYENIVRSITNIDKEVPNLDNEIERKENINRLNSEIEKLQTKIRNEKQFNIKVQYNERIIDLKKEIEELNNNG